MSRRPVQLVALGMALAGFAAGCGVPEQRTPAPGEEAGAVAQVYRVDGMHCTGCERAIAAALEALPGVVDAEASFSNGVVRVSGDRAGDAEAVAAALEPLGYAVAARSDSE